MAWQRNLWCFCPKKYFLNLRKEGENKGFRSKERMKEMRWMPDKLNENKSI